MNLKRKVRIEILQMNIDIFSNHFFFEINRLFVLVYTNEDVISKRFKAKIMMLSLMEKTIKEYTTGWLLDYDYINNNYRLITIKWSVKKEVDADPRAIEQIEFVGQLKQLDANYNLTDEAGNDQSKFLSMI